MDCLSIIHEALDNALALVYPTTHPNGVYLMTTKKLTLYQRAKKAAKYAETISDIANDLGRGDLAWYFNARNRNNVSNEKEFNRSLNWTLKHFVSNRKKLNALVAKFNEVA